MIRTPSAQRAWDTFFSGDTALKQPPPAPADDASAESKAEHAAAIESYVATLKACRETGNWTPLLVEGQSPTKFVLGQVDRNIWRSIMDRAMLPGDSPRHIGHVTLLAILFRLSIKSIVGWDKFDRRPDSDWDGWEMAPAALVTQLDETDEKIVGEIGSEVFARLRGLRPLT